MLSNWHCQIKQYEKKTGKKIIRIKRTKIKIHNQQGQGFYRRCKMERTFLKLNQ